ncbi:ECF RNA polymerase sigma factor SigK [Knoellia sp. CPCC 206435]|uniref:ECF RNA polymerase sigma factor SigK n=1 Tax=Knoellia terrae TaxID=3404797 RepID=UPI003B43360C
MVIMAAVGSGDESLPTAAVGPDLGALLARSARGDEAAFAELYDATATRLHGLVVRVVRDRAQSEEVTQDAYLDIWRHCTRYDASRGSALSWMLTIAHRKAVDRIRSVEASKAREVTYETTTAEREHDSTLEQVEVRLDQQRVRRALASLTDTQRGAVELAYLGGHTHTEVAALLDIPLGTAKTRIRDGLIRLRDTLEVTA